MSVNVSRNYLKTDSDLRCTALVGRHQDIEIKSVHLQVEPRPLQTREKDLYALGHPPETRRKVSFYYFNSHILIWQKNVLSGINHVGKTKWEHF